MLLHLFKNVFVVSGNLPYSANTAALNLDLLTLANKKQDVAFSILLPL